MNEYVKVEDMEPEIVKYCDIYSKDLSERLGLNEAHLSNAVSFPALLNPMFGNKKLIADSGLMTEAQCERAKGQLLQRMVRILDRMCPSTSQCTASGDGLDSKDDDVEFATNKNYEAADKERNFLKPTKSRNIVHMWKLKTARTLGEGNHKILVGPVESKGEDLLSGKIIADYVDECGRIDLLRFFEDHSNMFPIIWIISQCEMSNQVVEVGCERFSTYLVMSLQKSGQD